MVATWIVARFRHHRSIHRRQFAKSSRGHLDEDLCPFEAVGLSAQADLARVIIEYTFLAVFGALAGAFIGAFASELFVPFFRFTGEQGAPLPPLLPIIARQEVRNLALGFSLVVVLAEVATIASALYRRVMAALKMPWV
jgi:hypothetical protein